MLTYYIVAAVVGVALIMISALAGGHSEHDASHDSDHDGGHSEWSADWVPFFSIRFWTYFLAVFGVVGILLTLFKLLASGLILPIALVSGFITGYAVFRLMRIAMKYQSDSLARTEDLLGAEARVMVAIRPSLPGKVRLSAKGEIIEMLALPDGDRTLEAGMDVVVTQVEEGRVVVVPKDELFDSQTIGTNP